MIISLGIKASALEELIFLATSVHLPNGWNVFLEYRELNVFTILSESSGYTITTDIAIKGVGRFYIHTTSQALSINNIPTFNNINMYVKEKSLARISGLKYGNTKVKLYSLLGNKFLIQLLKLQV